MAGATVHGSGEGIRNGAFGLNRWFRIRPEETGGAFALWEEEIPEGAGPPLHVHENEIELFTVLSGRVRFRCADAEHEAGPGASVMIPKGAHHTFKGLGPGPSRALVMLSPGAGVGFFETVEAEGLSPATDMPRIEEICARYGVRFVGPPLD